MILIKLILSLFIVQNSFALNIIGFDNRVEITDASRPPYRFMGKLTFLRNGLPDFCNATLIGDDLILTAAECVFNADGIQNSNFRFISAYKLAGKEIKTEATLLKYGAQKDFSALNNWAIFTLKSKFGKLFGYMGVTSPKNIDFKKNSVMLAGYIKNYSDNIHQDNYCDIVPNDGGQSIGHNCDTNKKGRGSMLFVKEDLGHSIIGMNIESNDLKIDCRYCSNEVDKYNRAVNAEAFISEIIKAKEQYRQTSNYVYFCNSQSEDMKVSYAYYVNSNGDYVSRGWFSASQSECKEVNIGTNIDSKFYVYSSKLSTGYLSFCIHPTKAFEYLSKDHSGSCLENQRRQSFSLMEEVKKETPTLIKL